MFVIARVGKWPQSSANREIAVTTAYHGQPHQVVININYFTAQSQLSIKDSHKARVFYGAADICISIRI
jgi:hypothetical protein